MNFDKGLGVVDSYGNSDKIIAFFGRANINIKGNYFVSLSSRYEGSSRFGANNKWGLFPAASAGVTLSNLFSIPMVNTLKFRASYGVTGNRPADSYLSIPRVGRTGNFFYNNEWGPSYGPVSNANPNLKWETKAEIDFGFDFSMLDSRLSGTVDYYNRATKDLLLPVNVPIPPNQYRETMLNIGKLNNHGFELALNYLAINSSRFTWTTGANFATMKTKVISLHEGGVTAASGGILYRANFGSPGQNNTTVVRVKEGEQLGEIWGPVLQSVNSDSTLTFKSKSGTFCNCDDDRQVIGHGLPKFTIGWNNSLTLGRFDINIFLRGSFGHQLVNSYRGFYENNEPTTIVNYNIVKTRYYDPNVKKAVFNSSHVEKASFAKLDNMSIGYNIPLVGKALRKARIYVSGQNLFIITRYTGVDPEVRYVDTNDINPNGFFPAKPDALAAGVERRSTYFTTRTYTVGINLSF